MASYKTRAGIMPSEGELPFSITTTDVEKYLQSKLDIVVDRMKKENDGVSLDNIDLRVTTVEMGRYFFPFAVVLPMSVAKNHKNNKQQKNELGLFNPKQNDSTVILHENIMRFFSSYIFDKGDGEAFFSADWRRARGVSNQTSGTLKMNRLPRRMILNNGSMECITFLIDPIRVFHDMLIMPDSSTNFHVDVENWQKIRSGEYRYDIVRRINKKKKGKGGNSFADELNRKMKGFH